MSREMDAQQGAGKGFRALCGCWVTDRGCPHTYHSQPPAQDAQQANECEDCLPWGRCTTCGRSADAALLMDAGGLLSLAADVLGRVRRAGNRSVILPPHLAVTVGEQLSAASAALRPSLQDAQQGERDATWFEGEAASLDKWAAGAEQTGWHARAVKLAGAAATCRRAAAALRSVHQGEPVAWRITFKGRTWYESADALRDDHFATMRGLPDLYHLVPLYAAPAPAPPAAPHGERERALEAELHAAAATMDAVADGLDAGARAHDCAGWDCATCGVNQQAGELREQASAILTFLNCSPSTPVSSTDGGDERVRCTCEWTSEEDGSIGLLYPHVLDSACAVHGAPNDFRPGAEYERVYAVACAPAPAEEGGGR